jgi:hypothetical protein
VHVSISISVLKTIIVVWQIEFECKYKGMDNN